MSGLNRKSLNRFSICVVVAGQVCFVSASESPAFHSRRPKPLEHGRSGSFCSSTSTPLTPFTGEVVCGG